MHEFSPSRPLTIRIVTPSFNQADFVERAVRSVVSQNLEGVELDYIVYDALSTDGSQDILRRLAAEFPQITMVFESDEGQADALKKGFDGCDADVVGWLNSDDLLLPGALTTLAREFCASDVDVLYGNAWFIDQEDQIVGAYPTCDFDIDLLKTFCFISQPSTFFRTSAYNLVGGIDSSLHYCMDYMLWLRLALSGFRFKRLDFTLSATRLHGATKTADEGSSFAAEVCRSLEGELGYVPKEWLVYQSFRESLDKARFPARYWHFLKACAVEGLRQRCLRRIGLWVFRVYRAHIIAYAHFRLGRRQTTSPWSALKSTSEAA